MANLPQDPDHLCQLKALLIERLSRARLEVHAIEHELSLVNRELNHPHEAVWPDPEHTP